MNKDDQTYIADETTTQEDLNRYEEAVKSAHGVSSKGLVRYPESRPSKLRQLHKALRRRRAKNKVAKQSRKVNR